MIEDYPHPNVRVNTSIPEDLWRMAKANHISWNEALIFGLKFKLADRHLMDYPSCQLAENLKKAMAQLNEACEDRENFRMQLEMKNGAKKTQSTKK